MVQYYWVSSTKKNPFVPLKSPKSNIEQEKEKNGQFSSKSPVTIQGVNKQINRHTFVSEGFNNGYDTVLQGNSSKGRQCI